MELKLSKKKGFYAVFFFLLPLPDNILNEIKYRSHLAWTFGLHSANYSWTGLNTGAKEATSSLAH